ncbi:hypothetical protein PHISCL_05018 [Aspergillus sclerotialis]|uniref:Uncharacterized protein n=1 Tax=Aspergillus sclerotialis TaxID=2070753 RepID=A0A3A2ZXB3_9EURO|nr:hypothetical protein PHISCL_05018 [Aspergillus sclerotialis]
MARTRRRRIMTDDEDEEESTSSEYSPSYSPEPINILKETLDSGELTTKSLDREFTNFLDFRDRYHKEFMDNLHRHVQEGSYSIKSLAADGLEQRMCAMSFLDKYGEMYWGTKENREKYLEPDRLAKPEELAIYPLREGEIARAIKILLEKKARRGWRSSEKVGQTSEVTETGICRVYHFAPLQLAVALPWPPVPVQIYHSCLWMGLRTRGEGREDQPNGKVNTVRSCTWSDESRVDYKQKKENQEYAFVPK